MEYTGCSGLLHWCNALLFFMLHADLFARRRHVHNTSKTITSLTSSAAAAVHRRNFCDCCGATAAVPHLAMDNASSQTSGVVLEGLSQEHLEELGFSKAPHSLQYGCLASKNGVTLQFCQAREQVMEQSAEAAILLESLGADKFSHLGMN